ncbi:MAG: hypothetical protein ACYTES_06020 [Planctomycetota bacterium]
MPVQVSAWLMGLSAFLCVPLIIFTFLGAVVRPDLVNVTSAALLALALAVAPFLLVPASLLVFDWGQQLRRGGMRRGAECHRRGYDLRAATSARCPECGTHI